ncbi:hypothetical protein HDV04_004474 [Boothiomyces sp. JEL0838]|nr:hypothetical protein HDV04_004474 [Boothiomyces sp. JEL0838]
MAETQNSTQINALIEQRIITLKYLSRIFDGHGRYLGTVKIPLGKLYEMYSAPIGYKRTVADILEITYEKLKPNTNSDAYFELVNKLDAKLWKLAVAPVMRDLDALGGDLLSAELAKLIETKTNSYS